MSPRHRVLAVVMVLCAACALSRHSFLGPVEAQGGTAIQIDVAANRHSIDPRVYGVNWADAAQLAALNVPIHRWGGNSTTRHNWKTNGDNRGSDWYFESIPGSGPQGAAFDDFVQLSKQNGAEPMLTIPLIGWVGRNGPGGTKLASFSAAKYGAQQDCDWSWFPDACNGVRTNGTNVTGNDPNDANVASNPQYQKDWAQHLVTRWGLAAAGGIRYYIYDNETSLWHHTHRDVHPAGQTMTELRDLMIAYGTAVRQADPGAIFVGPEEWGWSGYFLSGYDQKYGADTGCWSCAPDKAANGGVDFMPWLLAQMRQHEQGTGNRLLHVFSLHYYPQGGEFGSDTSSSMQALRNRSTRSLWDPNYTDETWIGDKVRLIPRMKDWVNANYPGLETGITEYSWGADDHINGATAHADVLGIFGREGLNVGTRWVVPAAGTPTFKAIQMYRNYDGARSTFGDVSVKATVPNPDSVAAFAAERSSDSAVTVMAINKTTSSALVSLSLSNFAAGATAQVWRLTSTNAIQRLADANVAGGAISATLAAQSITLFVVPRSSSVLPSLSVGDVSVSEGGSGSANASFTVGLSAASSQAVTVGYATTDGTATAGSDYVATSGTLTIAAGQTTNTVAVPVFGDILIEADETFNVTLTGPTNATIADGQGVGTIVNDDIPTLSIGDVAVTEGNGGTTTATFTVVLSAASPQPVTVSYATANGTATAGTDYVAQAGNLTFTAGQTSKTIAVVVNGDTTVEPNETFLVNLSSPTGATLADAQGQGSITNDDVVLPGGEPVSWVGVVGAAPNGNSLTKPTTAPLGWNSGAVSAKGIASGDGNVEFTASAVSWNWMAGLSRGDTDTSYQDIDYALYLYNGYVYVYENGVYRGGFSSYAAGDRFQVAVESGKVKYRQNGALLYQSTIPVTASSYPLVLDTALFTPGATLTNATLSGASIAVENAVWTRVAGVSTSGNSLTKTAAVGWNAGGVSTRAIASGDGYVEFTAAGTTWNWLAGLSHGDTDTSYQDIDYAIYLYNGYVYVYEAGMYRGGFSSYMAGARFQVAVQGGVVRYRQNGVTFYQSTVPVTSTSYPLVLDTALFTPGAILAGATISGTSLQDAWTLPSESVTWGNRVGVNASGATLTKTAVVGWNAGAASTRAIVSGDGYVEFTASGTAWNWMAGLSKGDTDQSYQDIDYALYFYNGYVYCYEGGVYRRGFSRYAAGDRFQVAVESGVVRYRQNGTLLYQSTVPVGAGSYPLVLDTALFTPGATLASATIAGTALQ